MGIMNPDNRDYGEYRSNLVSDNDATYTIDTVLIKGVSQDREKNECNYDYNLVKDNEAIGMKFYMHKYF